eukprot:SAG31_NODE_9683_length_1242_cov_0.966754_1_plen_382_part_01
MRAASTARRLAADWEAQLDAMAVKMRPLVRAGFIEAVFLGDEICCHCPSCLNATLAPVARRLRSHFPDPKVLLIWANECDSSIVGGIGHGGAVTPPLPRGPGAIPSEIDLLSVDIYRGFGNDTLPGAAEVAEVSAFFTEEIFPRMHATQRAMAVPGFFGCTNCVGMGHGGGCGSLAQQEARMLDKLSAYRQYLTSEPRMAGLAPWHMDNRNRVGCDVAVKPNCHDCDMKLGAASFPRLLAAWQEFGASIVHAQTRSSRRTPCVQSGDGAAGLSLCFTGPQVSVTAADNHRLAEHTSGFSLLVHNDNAEPSLLNANNLLQNANFSQVDNQGELLDWGAVGLGMYTRTSDPAHTRPGGPGTAVIVNNTNGSVAGFQQYWIPATP